MGAFRKFFVTAFATFLIPGYLLAASQYRQIVSKNFDIDDNILITPAKVIPWDLETQRLFPVSTAAWALMKVQAAAQGFELRDGYLADFVDDSAAGNKTFSNQILKALTQPKWKGPRWDDFVKALSEPETRRWVTLISARGHERESILEGLRVIQQTKDKTGKSLLGTLPDVENIFPVFSSHLQEEYKAATPAESKAKVMEHFLTKISEVEVPKDATLVDSREGDGTKQQLHLWEFSDDDYNNIYTAFNQLSPKVKAGKWSNVKIKFVFTGLNNPAREPHSFVIKPDGSARPALESELD